MADMELSYDELVAVVRAEGVDLREVNLASLGKTYSSRNMCRCHSGDVNQTRHVVGGSKARSWAPTGDMTIHITAGDLGSRTAEQYILDILLTNPNAPLAANFAVAADGVAYILSAGRTNHDLNCSAAAKAAYDNSSWSLDGYQDLRGTGVDPKTFTYGIENISGSSLDTKPLARATSVRISAAICRAYRRNGRNVAGHGECASDRSYADPGINMGQFRRDVMARVAAGPTAQEDDMPSPADVWSTPLQLKDSQGKFLQWVTPLDLLNTAWQQDNAQNAALKALTDAVAKLANNGGAQITSDQVEQWVKEGIADAASAKFEGTLTVTPAPDQPKS